MSKLLRCFLCSLLSVVMYGCGSVLDDTLFLDKNDGHDFKEAENTVSLEEAENELLSILDQLECSNSRGFDDNRREIGNSFSMTVGERKTREDEGGLKAHVFNFEDEKGFAIMSGDKRFPSLIALTESGFLEEDSEIDNPGLAIFLENIEREYMLATAPATRKQSPKQDEGENIIEPGPWHVRVHKNNAFCNVKWGQGDPYNMFCPKENGTSMNTGCVATALAQLMSVYKYPLSFDGHLLNWEEMTIHPYATDCSEFHQYNIAFLMEYLGRKDNLDMSYGREVSTANSENVCRTLKSLGYSNSGKYSEYDSMSVRNELLKGYPVLAGGCCYKHVSRFLGIKIKTSYSGGHQWLMHGMLELYREVKRYSCDWRLISTYTESKWYPQCNWGWDGDLDGYYLDEAFSSNNGTVYDDQTRSESGGTYGDNGNFQYNLTSITGIRK